MIKIPTIFERDESQRGHPVIDQVKAECQWVLDGEGFATIKIDGTNVKIEGGQLFKRQKPKEGDYDMVSYMPADRNNPSDKWLWVAFDRSEQARLDEPPVFDGIYEVWGNHMQGNPYGLDYIRMTMILPPAASLVIALDHPAERSFDGLRVWLASHNEEGLVFHHPDGRMAKIKRRDFGLPWPLTPNPRRSC